MWRDTIRPKMITDFTVADLIFELIKTVTTVFLCGGIVSELIKSVLEINPLRGDLCTITDTFFLVEPPWT